MEIENRFASRGVGAAGLTTGIIGTAGFGLQLLNGLLNGGAAGNAANHNCMPSENMPVNRYELNLQQELQAEKAKNSLLESTVYTDQKLNALRDYVDGKFACVNDKLATQAVHNATNDAVLGCMQNQINTLLGLTKVIVPATNICPAPMPKYNSWTAPTAPATGG